MRNITFTIAILFLFSTSELIAEQYVYPSLDRALISLWKSAHERDMQNSIASLSSVLHEWNSAKNSLVQSNESKIDTKEFVNEIEYMMKGLRIYTDNGDLTHLEQITYQLLWDFSLMRDCIGIENYPIDRLLHMHITYNEIHYTVHDEMMGLRYWFEFQDIVDEFIEHWEGYDCMGINEIQSYFDNVNPTIHKDLKQTLNTCLENFIESMDSGYRTDFELPCDEMGNAVRELIWLYSINTIK